MMMWLVDAITFFEKRDLEYALYSTAKLPRNVKKNATPRQLAQEAAAYRYQKQIPWLWLRVQI